MKQEKELEMLWKTCLIETVQRLGSAEESVSCQAKGDIIWLSGNVEKWQTVVDLGHAAAKFPHVRDVVNNLQAQEVKRHECADTDTIQTCADFLGAFDVVVIGAGITGCAIARQLSRYKLSIAVVEKEEDISCGTTKANNGMIHSGYDSKHGSLKARLNVKGNTMYSQWAQELDFKFNRTGSFVLAFDEQEKKQLEHYLENGTKNGVLGISLISGDEARAIEPGIADDALWALWTPTAGYVEPYEVTLALAENAVDNGARFFLDCGVSGLVMGDGRIQQVLTTKGILQCGHVINAAGLYADEIAKMADDQFYTIHPRRGALVIFDKENAGKIKTFSGLAPGPYSKGGGPGETPEGTLLWGPSAREVWDKEDLEVEQDEFDYVVDKGMKLVKGIRRDSVITYFGGNRAATYSEDFVVENSGCLANFTHAAGIQSPGLASAPAIAELVEELYLQCHPDTMQNPDYNPIRTARKPFRDCTPQEQARYIEENPLHGRIICRCETVTEGEVVEAVHGKIPAVNMDAVKRRVRAGMGRCQSGFCGARVLEILAREQQCSKLAVTLKGRGSEILTAETRQVTE